MMGTALRADGYGVEGVLDDEGLTLAAKGRGSAVALLGADLVEQKRTTGTTLRFVHIPRDEIADVTWRAATLLTNGQVTVHTTAGKEYKAHFRRKQQGAWRAVYDALA